MIQSCSDGRRRSRSESVERRNVVALSNKLSPLPSGLLGGDVTAPRLHTLGPTHHRMQGRVHQFRLLQPSATAPAATPIMPKVHGIAL